MSGTTTNLGLPYPMLGDGADIETFGVEPLAVAIDDKLVHVGDLKATARATAPTGWLLCDGSAISRTTYATLFTAISTAYGAGNGTTTFNVPDLRGRVPVGVDGAAGRLTANDALGQSGGEETHLLDKTEIASVGAPAGSYGTTTGSANGIGAGVAHNNMQPYAIVNWLIKT